MKKRAYALPIDTRRTYWSSPDRRSHGSFTPNGPLIVNDSLRQNPIAWEESGELWTGRIFVGLSVGQDEAWSENDVVGIVSRVRKEQVGAPDSSFVRQRGLYTQTTKTKDGDKVEVVDENSIQIFILNLSHFETDPDDFKKQMVELGEKLCQELEQKEVIIEIQRNGIIQYTMSVAA